VIDGMEDEAAQPWRACLTGWCGFVDHVSFSLVNAQLPHMYTEAGNKPDVGFVLGANMSFDCAMVQDGGTIMDERGGCDRCTCGDPGCWWCVYRRHQVGAFVHSHLTSWCNGQPCSNLYNEVVMPKVDYEAALPHSIRAVFCTRSATCDDARDVHTRFLQRRTT